MLLYLIVLILFIFLLPEAGVQAMIEKREWLIDMGAKRSDESKRQGKAISYCDLFGMEGSFRMLTVD